MSGNPFADSGADSLFFEDSAAGAQDGPAFDYVSLDDGRERFPGEEEEIGARGGRQKQPSQPVVRQTSSSSQRASESFPGADEPVFGGSRDSSGFSASDLERREREVAARERLLAEREATGKLQRAKNWPCRCLPLAYHSIADEIRPDSRAFVRKLYALLLLTWVALLWNAVTLFVIWIEESKFGSETLWAAGYVLLGVPGSWFLWYRNAYYANKGDSAARWILFFVFFCLLHIGFGICMAVGIPKTNAAGLLLFIRFSKNSTVFVFTLVSACVWTIIVLLSLWLTRSAVWFWKHGGETELEKQVREDRKSVV